MRCFNSKIHWIVESIEWIHIKVPDLFRLIIMGYFCTLFVICVCYREAYNSLRECWIHHSQASKQMLNEQWNSKYIGKLPWKWSSIFFDKLHPIYDSSQTTLPFPNLNLPFLNEKEETIYLSDAMTYAKKDCMCGLWSSCVFTMVPIWNYIVTHRVEHECSQYRYRILLIRTYK